MPNQILKITAGGRSYRLDFGKLMYSEAKMLQKHTGLSVKDLGPALQKDGNLDAVAFVIWLCQRRAGEDPGPFEDFDFDLMSLDLEPEADPEEVADDPADPTPGGGDATAAERSTTSNSSSATTSPGSATSSESTPGTGTG